jgi:hypothetical protein
MDLTAAFEELLREKAGEKDINIATEYPLLSAFTREQLEAIKVRSKELTATMGQIKAASPLLPQHPNMQLDRAYSTHPVGHYQ